MNDVVVTPQTWSETAAADAGISRTGAASVAKNNKAAQGFASIFSNALETKRMPPKFAQRAQSISHSTSSRHNSRRSDTQVESKGSVTARENRVEPRYQAHSSERHSVHHQDATATKGGKHLPGHLPQQGAQQSKVSHQQTSKEQQNENARLAQHQTARSQTESRAAQQSEQRETCQSATPVQNNATAATDQHADARAANTETAQANNSADDTLLNDASVAHLATPQASTQDDLNSNSVDDTSGPGDAISALMQSVTPETGIDDLNSAMLPTVDAQAELLSPEMDPGNSYSSADSANQMPLADSLTSGAASPADANDPLANGVNVGGHVNPLDSSGMTTETQAKTSSSVANTGALSGQSGLSAVNAQPLPGTDPAAANPADAKRSAVDPQTQALIKEMQGPGANPQHSEIADQRLQRALQEHGWKDLLGRAVSEAAQQKIQASADAKLDHSNDLRQLPGQLYSNLLSQAALQDGRSATMSTITNVATNLAADHGAAIAASETTTEVRPTDSQLPGATALAGQRPPPAAMGNLMAMLQSNPQTQHSAWSHEMGNKMMFMIKQDIQSAQLQMNPQHLGPLEVRISVGQDQQVNVAFTSQHAAVRDALDGAMTRLRDMLEQQGFSLNEFTVSDQAQKQQQDAYARQQLGQSQLTGYDAEDDLEIQEIPQGQHSDYISDKLVDYFA